MLRAGVVLTLLLAGCATGATVDEGFEELTGGGSDDGLGGAGGDDQVVMSGAGGAGGDFEQAGGGGMGGAGGAGGSAGGCSYISPNNCGNAQPLGSVAGDKGSNPVVDKGTTSKWVKVHVKEEDGSIFDADLSYTVTLESKPGMDFDLYVLEGPQGGGPNCAAVPTKGTGTPEAVYHKWDDDQPFGGEDDSVWLCIEVRYVSGNLCGAAAEWTLTIKGNT